MAPTIMKCIFYLIIISLFPPGLYSQSTDGILSHYLFPEFSSGKVLMWTGQENEALLNYNSLSEEMVFEKNGKKLAINKAEAERIDTVFIEDRKFVLVNNKFVELIYQSTYALFAEHKCKLEAPGKSAGYGGTSNTSAISSYSAFHSETGVYNLKLPDGYKAKPYIFYWLKQNDDIHPFTNMKQLMKLFDSKKGQFKAYAKEQNIKYDNQEGIVNLISYLEKI